LGKKVRNPHKQKSTGKIVNPHDEIFNNPVDPVFCFKYLHRDFSIDTIDKEKKGALLDQLYKLSQLTFQDIIYSQRHGLGTEKISKSSIKPKIPNFVTDEVELIAFRYSGKLPFLGFRNRNVLHLIFIENNFGDVYNH
jgi:hypothetical protein